ncbi:MAG: hypothetical protein HY693_05475 [Deltaproteobacteria bacterium]|nr:hypothetical protein [Deltaproteobacteria bacterium]
MIRTKSILKADSNNRIKKKKFISDNSFVLKLSIILSLIIYIGCAALSGDPVGPPPDPVTVKEILEMTEAGIPPQIIIDKIQESHTVYRLQASQLVQLKEMGVSDEVINYMQQTYIDAVRQNQAYEDWSNFTLADDGFWYGGPFYGGPFWY